MRPLTTHIHARCGAPLRLLCSAAGAGDVPFFDAPLLTSRDNAKLKLVRKLRDSRRQQGAAKACERRAAAKWALGAET